MIKLACTSPQNCSRYGSMPGNGLDIGRPPRSATVSSNPFSRLAPVPVKSTRLAACWPGLDHFVVDAPGVQYLQMGRQNFINGVGRHQTNGRHLDHRSPGLTPLLFEDPYGNHGQLQLSYQQMMTG